MQLLKKELNSIKKELNNKIVLITGGSGSFGQMCVKVLLDKFNVKKIIIFSRDELKQFEMKKKFVNHDKLRFFIGDVRDLERLNEAFFGVDIVIHAAAQKQVDTAEYNPLECIKTNIYGSENVIKASLQNGVIKSIALSTDKAVNPLNLYGGTKLLLEKLFVSANNTTGKRRSIFSVVRYGNVLNSRGSVVEYFLDILKSGGKDLPITHKDMTRFFLTLEESVYFVLKNIYLMKGGEIFIPKIPSIKITDLAKSINSKVKLKFIGVREGEKLDEVLCAAESSANTIEFKSYYLMCPVIKYNKPVNYFINSLGEKGKKVSKNFYYSSKNNKVWFSVDQMKKVLKRII
tara:strand:+ start:221 stop:1258 length:1038 start_codon:yes stop_codon:yes gene_type:complete